MSKRSQRKLSVFEEGRKAKRDGVLKCDLAYKPYGRGLGIIWLAGYHLQDKKTYFPKTIMPPTKKTQTEKNQAKRERKRLRVLFS